MGPREISRDSFAGLSDASAAAEAEAALGGFKGLGGYPMGADWVFASPSMGGKQPYWPDNFMKRYIKPVARKAGITKNIGWHTFRHSFGTLLKANGEDIKTVQELLRYAYSRIMLVVYTQAVTSNKRAAQSKVVRMMVSNVGTVLSDMGTTDFEKVAVNAR